MNWPPIVRGVELSVIAKVSGKVRQMPQRDVQLAFAFRNLSRIVNVASVPKLSPFRYPGGKTWLIPQIRRWLGSLRKTPKLLIESFAGGGSVGLTAAFEGLVERTLLVELDRDVAAVWQVVFHPKKVERLIDRILSLEVTTDVVKKLLARKVTTIEDRAFVTLLRNRVQHGGILADGASLIKTGENGKGIASRWYPETLARRLREIHGRRDRIGFCCANAFEVFDRYADAENVVFFVDPPYTLAGRRLYRHSSVDHEQLFLEMSHLKGDFLLTYDNTPEVRLWAEKRGFDVEEISMKSRQHSEKTELLIGRDLNWAR
jgi:DNA adenine methylase